MKVLSIKQPWAYLICAGIKDIENRSWKLPEMYKGQRVLIHASNFKEVDLNKLFYENSEQLHEILIREHSLNELHEKLKFGAIIGSVEFSDCVINDSSIWADKSTSPVFIKVGNEFIREPIYNWILSNPILFKEPIENIKGKLRFWNSNFDEIICPECNHIQLATVRETELWNVFIHKCIKCGYMITESDWERI